MDRLKKLSFAVTFNKNTNPSPKLTASQGTESLKSIGRDFLVVTHLDLRLLNLARLCKSNLIYPGDRTADINYT